VSDGSRPLSGVRVLDLSRAVAGPTCCYWLAALGAEVIRIESPDGDIGWRTYPRVGPTEDHEGELGPRDIPLSPLRKQRGKRSVVLDLGAEGGRDVLRRLVRVSDVLVENMKPGTMDAWGVGWCDLEALNPRLVYACITGYGVDGPYRDKPAMDPVIQAVSGLMARTGQTEGPPTRVGATIGDQLPGVWTALGVLAALRQRDADGRGQLVDVAMLDALVALSWDDPLDLYEDQGLPERVGNGDPRGAPFNVFATRDGWVAIAAAADGQWARLAPVLGEAGADPRWKVHRERALHRDDVESIVASWCAARSTGEVVDALEARGVPVGPVNPPWWARHDPHVAHRGVLERLRHPDRDEPTQWLGPRLPVHFSRAETSTSPAEPLGESTDAVLRTVAGLDDDEIAALRASGAMG
jgi:crotonobetainyl-CoA:carnitine CoA-transferase CaiB-like acyl-CoA transferase